MIKAIVSDSSKTLIFPIDETVSGSINKYYLSVNEQSENFDVYKYFRLNDRLINFLKKLDLPKYVFTTGAHIQNDAQIAEVYGEVFDNVFTESFADDFKKEDLNSFKVIAKKLDFNPSEILYLDDKKENTDAAERAGYVTVLVKENEETISKIELLLSQ